MNAAAQAFWSPTRGALSHGHLGRWRLHRCQHLHISTQQPYHFGHQDLPARSNEDINQNRFEQSVKPNWLRDTQVTTHHIKVTSFKLKADLTSRALNADWIHLKMRTFGVDEGLQRSVWWSRSLSQHRTSNGRSDRSTSSLWVGSRGPTLEKLSRSSSSWFLKYPWKIWLEAAVAASRKFNELLRAYILQLKSRTIETQSAFIIWSKVDEQPNSRRTLSRSICVDSGWCSIWPWIKDMSWQASESSSLSWSAVQKNWSFSMFWRPWMARCLSRSLLFCSKQRPNTVNMLPRRSHVATRRRLDLSPRTSADRSIDNVIWVSESQIGGETG